jgi:Rubisco LSMT substrate-binding./SET domain.
MIINDKSQEILAGQLYYIVVDASKDQIIMWNFREISNRNIIFSIKMETNEEEKIIVLLRCSTDEGKYRIDKPCKIIMQWDNSYSFIISKTIVYSYKIESNLLKSHYKGGDSDDEKISNFLNWLSEGDAKYSNLIIKHYKIDNRGVHAKTNLKKDETILEVPLNLIITNELAQNSDVNLKLKNSGCTIINNHTWLAAYLLQEKYNKKSKWRPYIDILPKYFRHMPIFFDENELKYLKGSFTLKMIEDRKESLKSEYDNIVKCFPEFEKFSYLDFVWARLVVITRIFGFTVNGHKTEGLVPMADMLNHKRPEETNWTFDQSKMAFTITTTRELEKGSEIYDSYGRKCNSRYFVNYGFSLDNNEDNQVAMFFNISKTDDLYQIKKNLVGSDTKRFQIPFDHKEYETRNCMSYLRIICANIKELDPLIKRKNLLRVDPISTRNESAVLLLISKEAKRVLDGFETTIEEDDEILQSDELTMNIRNCILMRRGEKEVLHAYINLAEKIDKIKDYDLKTLEQYLQREIYNKDSEPSIKWRTEMYFREIWIPLVKDINLELVEINNNI